MSKARLLALPLLICLLLAGCGEEKAEPDPSPSPTSTSQAEQTPVSAEFALPCYPQAGFHPITGTNRTNLALGGLIYEGLFELDESFQPQNVLCTSYTVSENGLTWTFALEQGVTFSDGSTLTPQDVADSLNLARTSTLYASRLAGITGVTAQEGGVTVTLSAPNGALPALLDIPIVKGTGERPLGTGPYAISGEGETLTLTARAGWWQGRALPKQEIPLRAIQAADDLIHAFDTKDISLVFTDLTGTNALGFSGSYETVDCPTSVMLYVGFNCASGPCRDAGVRQALQRSFDRQSVATMLLARHAQAAALPVSPSSPLYDQELAGNLEYAPVAAEELLTGLGWSKGEDGVLKQGRQTLSLTFVVSSENTHKLAVAEHLAQGLQQLGIEVELKKLPWTEYLTALERGEFDLYLGEVRMTADFNPSALITPGGALNYGGYSDAQATQLLGAFRAASGESRTAAAQALYTRLAENPPFGVICFKNWSLLAQWGQVEGLSPTQQNEFHGFADWKIA
jgi:peptide/nickel transport system substrate-binding protein